MLTIKTKQAIKILKSNKDFILYNTDENNNLLNFSLCNDLRNRKQYKHFRVISTIKKDLEIITVK